ncbi:kinase-like domain-containing protein [Trametes meyenii]|nr:kinase-like domain-containing protein [Trametes meyenii]
MTETVPADPVGSSSRRRPVQLDGSLTEDEIWWRDHQVWLQEHGYLLRPRYRLDWVPSWKAKDGDYFMSEDGKNIIGGHVLDATRVADGAVVALKKVPVNIFPQEIEIARFLTSLPLSADPKNHCVPIYEVLDVPEDKDLKLIVMPLLRQCFDPRFLTVGEAMDFCRQAIEGLHFIHNHHVAHRDCSEMNIMMDPQQLFPDLYHFACPWLSRDLSRSAKHYTRTSRPTRYYYIDFGLSRKFDPAQGPPRVHPIWGADRSVPEFQQTVDVYDPFPTDVYYLGNAFRTVLLNEYQDLDFLKPLVDEMVQDEPAARPTMEHVTARFDLLLDSLSSSQLRSRLVPRNELRILGYVRAVAHAFRTLYYICTFRPALPRL